ncbi:MAG: MBL fold metallo-hydrolase [Chryseotalea sp. WA131a]|jgi:hypothetical protein|nr:MAG: MBL fold metallo-hydrolase [Chryseotalea sp. WA131a]
MKLKIFQSDKGDCLLLSHGSTNILVDGGLSSSYNAHVAPYLNKMRNGGEKIDLLCVSHIDEDHIQGILKLIEDEVDWRVFDHHQASGSKIKEPKSPRPPVIDEIWHNAFYDSISKNKGEIEEMLAASASIYSSTNVPELAELGGYAYSIRQAIQLSGRLRAEQLGLKLNKRFKGKLAMYRTKQAPIKIGTMTLSIIAPFEKDLKKLREEWNTWLKTNKSVISQIKNSQKKDEPLLTSNNSELLALAGELGNRGEVTTPNLASIMFLVEDGKHTVLMTGDGHSEDIMKGLEAINKLDRTKGRHVDVLKVQHHGSENNLDEEFCRTVTADHYVFCGNGAHHNPDLNVIKAIIDSRVGKNKAITPQAKNNFTLHFNSSSLETKSANKKHMKSIEDLVKKESLNSKKFDFEFMAAGKSYMDIVLK